MKQRSVLTAQLRKAWRACIEIDYHARRINSERSLQAAYWSQLNDLLSKSRRIFIEPAITISTGGEKKVYYPDLVVTNTRDVIGVVELKYLPRVKPKFEKDMNTLAAIARNRKRVMLKNDRYRGSKTTGEAYMLSDKIIFAWGGIHGYDKANYQDKNTPPLSKGYRILKDCFLEMHAETVMDEEPSIYYKKG